MITIYSLEEHEEWDSIVRSFKDCDVYWLSGYVKAFKIHGDGEPLLFYYQDDSVRGINLVMKRDIAKDKHFVGKLTEGECFDFASPYGYGGWLIEGSNSEILFDFYSKWCQKHSIVSEFVRFHPVIKNHEFSKNFYEVIPLGNTVVLDLSSPETIWANLTSTNRNMIRKAQKNGIKIYNGRNPELYETFRKIYNETMDKNEANNYYYFTSDFYSSICEDLPENAQIFYAVFNDAIIAASIMLTANRKMNYHLSGMLKEYRSLPSTNLLLYKSALWGSANGYKTLYLGGGLGSGEDSLYKFKKSFYRLDQEKRFNIGKKTFMPEKYDELLSMRQKPTASFFPNYRAD